jgi:hypothetical protein
MFSVYAHNSELIQTFMKFASKENYYFLNYSNFKIKTAKNDQDFQLQCHK